MNTGVMMFALLTVAVLVAHVSANRYSARFFTAKNWFAGTDANIWMSPRGTKGGSMPGRSIGGSRSDFERGTEYEYIFDTSDLDREFIQSITLSHDNSGWNPAWKVDKIVIRDLTRGIHYEFYCGCEICNPWWCWWCRNHPHKTVSGPKVDGKWSGWSAEKKCGSNQRPCRTRQCDNPAPGNGGKYCSCDPHCGVMYL